MKYRFTVASTDIVTATNLSLEAGAKVTIKAKGVINLATQNGNYFVNPDGVVQPGSNAPAGSVNFPPEAGDPMFLARTDQPYGTLLANLSSSPGTVERNPQIAVGAFERFTVAEDSFLFLNVNDSNRGDNAGAFAVKVRVKTPPPEPEPPAIASNDDLWVG